MDLTIFIFSVIIALLFAVLVSLAEGDSASAQKTTSDNPLKRGWEGFKSCVSGMTTRAAVAGFVIGAAYFFLPLISEMGGGWMPLAVILSSGILFVLIVMQIDFLRLWRKEGQLRKIFWFGLIAVAIWAIAKMAVTAIVMDLLKVQNGWTSIVMMMPELMLIASIGYLIIDTLYSYSRERKWRNGLLIPRAAFVLALIILAWIFVSGLGTDFPGFNGLFSSCSSCVGVGKAADTAEPTTGAAKNEPTQEDLDNLTVRRLTAEDLEDIKLARFKDYSDVLLDSSLSAKDKARFKETGFSDALTFGFKTNDKFAELEEEILRNPVVAVTSIEAIKDEKIGNQAVGELNPWMREMVELTNQHGISYWLEYRGDDGVVYVTPEFRKYAATLCIWLERLQEVGVRTWTTARNWCLNDAAMDNDRRGILASYQYEGEFYRLSYIGKNGATLLVIGFNTKDKRPAVPATPVQPTPTPPPTAKPTPPPTTAKPTPTLPPTTAKPSPVPTTPPPTAKPTSSPTPETPTLPPPLTPSPTAEPTKDPNSGSNPGGNEGPTANPGPTFYPSHVPETPTPGPTVTPVPEVSMTPAVPGSTDGGPWAP